MAQIGCQARLQMSRLLRMVQPDANDSGQSGNIMIIERIGQECSQLGESPIWDPGDGVLYFVDSLAGVVYCYDPGSDSLNQWHVSCDYLGSLALRAGGGAVLVMDDGFHGIDFATGETTPIVEPESSRDELCFNDCKVDRQGRLIAVSMHSGSSEAVGSIYRLDGELCCTRLDGDYICPNGPCWSPDGATLYVSDSYAEAIFAYDYDAATGAVSNRRKFLSTAGSGGYPDGCTVDAEGCLWSAHFDGGVIRRIAPDGLLIGLSNYP